MRRHGLRDVLDSQSVQVRPHRPSRDLPGWSRFQPPLRLLRANAGERGACRSAGVARGVRAARGSGLALKLATSPGKRTSPRVGGSFPSERTVHFFDEAGHLSYPRLVYSHVRDRSEVMLVDDQQVHAGLP